MRLFCAIELPSNVRRNISDYSENLHKLLPNLSASWTRETNLHLTIKFIGEVAESRAANLSSAVAHAVSSISTFRFRFAGNGLFPQRGSPRVIWIGIDDPPGHLASLHSRLEEECETEGFVREARSYHPHLTLARIRNNQNATALKSILQSTPFKTIEIEVQELCVFKSELSSKGSKYTVLARHMLQK